MKDGYNLMTNSNSIKKIKEQIQFLESLISDVEKTLQNINKIKNADKIEELSKIHSNFIDLSEEIIQYKIDLNYNKNA